MAGFASMGQVQNALSTGYGQFLQWVKTEPQACVQYIPATLWDSAGFPAAGTYGTVGKANGRVLTTDTGKIPFVNASNPKTMHMISAGLTSGTASTIGTMVLVDRISDVLLANAEATGTITGVDATSRLASGEGGMIWCEVQSALSAAANTLTLEYTDQDGNAGTTPTLTTVASAVKGRNPFAAPAQLWCPLASGDAGVRTLTKINLTSGTATGQICVCIVRPLAYIPITTVAVWAERDFVCELPALPRIYDNSCLQGIFIPNAAVTATFFGSIRIAQN